MRKRRIKIVVLSKWSDGTDCRFEWDEVVPFKTDTIEKVEQLYVGKRFNGRLKGTDKVESLEIAALEDCYFYPVEVFLSPKVGLMRPANATVTFGDYGSANPISNSTFEFNLDEGEGLSTSYVKVANRGESYAVSTRIELGEVWKFPKAEWDLHELANKDVDYTDASSFLWAEILFGIPKNSD